MTEPHKNINVREFGFNGLKVKGFVDVLQNGVIAAGFAA
ncbi:hypothetical protein ADIS_3308 [Lunatimonas lonarensis]|uniref:Uncharacterized protein n=1 Tax=Lunatimonas lonarensis TaxID=1232681 RepID=R7ZPZ0_9BACT|nr:hypothetical protein ADIS_3308 [Lunatimonas lonarensis]